MAVPAAETTIGFDRWFAQTQFSIFLPKREPGGDEIDAILRDEQRDRVYFDEIVDIWLVSRTRELSYFPAIGVSLEVYFDDDEKTSYRIYKFDSKPDTVSPQNDIIVHKRVIDLGGMSKASAGDRLNMKLTVTQLTSSFLTFTRPQADNQLKRLRAPNLLSGYPGIPPLHVYPNLTHRSSQNSLPPLQYSVEKSVAIREHMRVECCEIVPNSVLVRVRNAIDMTVNVLRVEIRSCMQMEDGFTDSSEILKRLRVRKALANQDIKLGPREEMQCLFEVENFESHQLVVIAIESIFGGREARSSSWVVHVHRDLALRHRGEGECVGEEGQTSSTMSSISFIPDRSIRGRLSGNDGIQACSTGQTDTTPKGSTPEVAQAGGSSFGFLRSRNTFTRMLRKRTSAGNPQDTKNRQPTTGSGDVSGSSFKRSIMNLMTTNDLAPGTEHTATPHSPETENTTASPPAMAKSDTIPGEAKSPAREVPSISEIMAIEALQVGELPRPGLAVYDIRVVLQLSNTIVQMQKPFTLNITIFNRSNQTYSFTAIAREEAPRPRQPSTLCEDHSANKEMGWPLTSVTSYASPCTTDGVTHAELVDTWLSRERTPSIEWLTNYVRLKRLYPGSHQSLAVEIATNRKSQVCRLPSFKLVDWEKSTVIWVEHDLEVYSEVEEGCM